jgi:hypothetical protein
MLDYIMEIHHGWTLWFWGEKTNRLSANMNPIVGGLITLLQIFNEMWIIVRKTLRLVLLSNSRNLNTFGAPKQNCLLIHIFFKGGIRHHICHPCEHWYQINIVVILEDCSHNIYHKMLRTITKNKLIWPFTLGIWHDTRLCTWSFHVLPPQPSNNKIMKGKPSMYKK